MKERELHLSIMVINGKITVLTLLVLHAINSICLLDNCKNLISRCNNYNNNLILKSIKWLYNITNINNITNIINFWESSTNTLCFFCKFLFITVNTVWKYNNFLTINFRHIVRNLKITLIRKCSCCPTRSCVQYGHPLLWAECIQC